LSADTPLREDEHLKRAVRHKKIGDLLAEAGDEWAAVPWFYSVYHLVKAALLVDPIWGDFKALSAISVDLIPDDRFTSRHNGRRRQSGQPKEWGVNELVLKLYRAAAGSYERLHQGSIDVRYGAGLPTGALPTLGTALAKIHAMHEAGDLVAPVLWVPGEE
jgi:hypothetical protein